MYFEIYKKGYLIKRGSEILSDINFTNELMTTPQLSLTLPIEYINYIGGREHIKLFLKDRCFWGIVKSVSPNLSSQTLEITLCHHIDEWNNRQISVNNAISDKSLNIIYKTDKSKDIIIRNFKNNEELVGRKLRLKYQDFFIKDKSKDGDEKKKQTLKEEIDEYISKNATVNAVNMETGNNVKLHFVSSTIEPHKLKTADKDAVSQGTYRAVFKTEKGSKITIPVSVSYVLKKSDTKGDATINIGEPEVNDELERILNDDNFVYYDWDLEFEDGVEDTKISYVYSKQSKYEALTKTMELTDDLFWRVGFENNKIVEVGSFGDKKPYIVSSTGVGENTIKMLSNPTIEYNFDNVVNVATVMCEKSDSGASSITLRDLYNMQNNKKLQDKYSDIWEKLRKRIDKFPIVILRDSNYSSVNNERDYTIENSIGNSYRVDIFANQSPIVAPNTSREYAIIDYESVALESGEIIEGTYDFNDISPVSEVSNKETQKLTNRQRIHAELVAYKSAIKKLKQARRSYSATFDVSKLPNDVNVGDKVRVVYSHRLFSLGMCSNYMKKILEADDWYYITKIDYKIDKDSGMEIDTITISKFLKIERDTSNQ